MEYIAEMKRNDLNVMSEFLVMAATLIDIKSRMLLPKKESDEEEEEDPRAELVQQLLEYKMYKCMAYEPVSYTHLDVYKRQVCSNERDCDSGRYGERSFHR